MESSHSTKLAASKIHNVFSCRWTMEKLVVDYDTFMSQTLPPEALTAPDVAGYDCSPFL
jgi:hypothetical protein